MPTPDRDVTAGMALPWLQPTPAQPPHRLPGACTAAPPSAMLSDSVRRHPPAASPEAPSAAELRQRLAHSAGLAAFIHGYPLLESMRTCRLQTRDEATHPGPQASSTRPPVNELLHWAGPTQAEDRDVVTPANDLMYTTAWIQLDRGPVVLTVPPADADPQRYHVLALYDAWTENFANPGPRGHAGQDLWLLPPGGDAQAMGVPQGAATLRCPTPLVWLLARVLVRDADDLPAARRLQARIGLRAPGEAAHAQRPEAVARWQGDTRDPIAARVDDGRPAEPLAAAFFTNLARALGDQGAPATDAALIAHFALAGLRPGDGFDWQGLDEPQRAGLTQAFDDGAHLLATQARQRRPRPWILSLRNGRYGLDHYARAVVAHIGLGALHGSEALYAASHTDAGGQLLDGRTGYRWHLPAGESPPAEAFWSITLYAADRYLYANPLRRHALGDRSQGLRRDPDGGLTLHIGHQPPGPDDEPNWLPAPAGRFYLVLRMYHPSAGAAHWRIPPLEPLQPRHRPPASTEALGRADDGLTD